MDDVLLGLAERTGSSKASFVMQALHVYLPELRRLLAEHNQLQGYPQRRLVTPAVVAVQDSRDFHSLSRQERRKLERDQKKASRGGDRG